MSEPVAELSRTDEGNVIIRFAGRWEVEMTPDHVDAFVLSLLRKAHPKDHMFVIPVPKEDAR